MSEKKIVVPQGMLEAALPFCQHQLHSALEAALLWLSENPIVPTERQTELMRKPCDLPVFSHHGFSAICTEWQRIMFLAPEPEVPEALKDLLYLEDFGNGDKINAAILEAYRRGVEGEKPQGATYRKCARPDCKNPPFKVGKRKKIYCSHSCAHLMAVRASRKRHPNGKA